MTDQNKQVVGGILARVNTVGFAFANTTAGVAFAGGINPLSFSASRWPPFSY